MMPSCVESASFGDGALGRDLLFEAGVPALAWSRCVSRAGAGRCNHVAVASSSGVGGLQLVSRGLTGITDVRSCGYTHQGHHRGMSVYYAAALSKTCVQCMWW